jgi:hypothetical protein
MGFSSGFSLPGLPGNLGIQPSLSSGGPVGGTGDSSFSGPITIVNQTQISFFPGSIPPTTEGNTLVVLLDLGVVPGSNPQSSSTAIYINSTGTPIGTDLVGRTIYDGVLLYSADCGPVNELDLITADSSTVGIGIFYLENIPGGVSAIQSPAADPAFPWRVAVYELSPCVFDVASAASTEVNPLAGPATWSGAITPIGTDDLAFAQFFYSQPSSGGGIGSPTWPTAMVLTPASLGLATYQGVVCILSDISGSTGFSVSVIHPSDSNALPLACFKHDTLPAIRMVDRKPALSDSGVLSIRTTEPGNLIVVMANSAASLSADADTLIPAGSVGDVSIWYCVSVGGSTAITFASTGGILAYELESDVGSFALIDVQSASVTPTSATTTFGSVWQGPTLTGTAGACAYFVAADTVLGQLVLSPDWKRDSYFLGGGGHVEGSYTMLNQANEQALEFYIREGLADAPTLNMLGVVFQAAAGTGSGEASDLNQHLPNVWIVS